MQSEAFILAIESSCDDTSAAIIYGNKILANVTASQKIHEQYGGVVPELASRDHQKNIIPVVDAAIKKADVKLSQIEAVAFTQGPGLMGSLLVGASVAKSLALALNVPLIAVNHMQAHILAHFIKDEETQEFPAFPFICLTISGGHTQLVKVNAPLDFELLGETTDDAVGEAFDKAAKLLGLGYPGGPQIDKLAKGGNPHAYNFSESKVEGFDFSFSGIKTSFLYFIQNNLQKDPDFVKRNLADICASYQRHLVHVLMKKFEKAILETGIKDIALAGGVAANSEVRTQMQSLGKQHGCRVFIPKFEYCTDNAAMIAIAASYKFSERDFCSMDIVPEVKMKVG